MNRYWEIISEKRDLATKSVSFGGLVCLSLILTPLTYAQETETVEFNSAFLRSAVDVSAFSQGNPVAPGTHRVDIYVNEHWKGRMDVTFALPDDTSRIAQPCFSLAMFSVMGVDIEKISAENLQKLKENRGCLSLPELLKETSVQFNLSEQRLDAQVAQVMLLRHPRGYVSPELWDHGVTAAMLQYDYNAYRAESDGSDDIAAQYLGLRGGFNLGAWRLRYRGTFNWTNQDSWRYTNANTYLERGIAGLKSRIVIGESTTDGQVFDSVGFRGVMLLSDDRMYSDAERGFAPVVRGTANSNALVSVTQRGVKLYETTVPPGPFEINDLYSTGSNGDLVVTVREANGEERVFTVAYATIPELLRPDNTRYSLMLGRYHNNSVNQDPLVGLATLRHGFSNLITGFGGVMGSENYTSASAGIALNTTAGALSADVTFAETTLADRSEKHGESVRFAYAKILPVTDTNVTLASYRYSSSGYYDINDAMYLQSHHAVNTSDSANRKNRLQLSISQDLGAQFGSISLSASTQDYWNRRDRDTEYQLGYSRSFRNFNLYVNAGRSRSLTNDRWDDRLSVGISLPLGSSSRAAWLNTSYTQERDHRGIQSSVSGALGENNQVNYSVFGNTDHYAQSGTKTTAGASGSWTSPYTTAGVNYSKSSGYQQYSANLSGGVIAVREGVVFTPVMGDTMAVVQAEHAQGARITNNTSLRLDKSGKAAIPYLSPYRQNTLELDPKGLSNDVSLEVTSQNTAPTAGAVVMLKYKTDYGYSALLDLQASGGISIPFGAEIVDEEGHLVGYMAQGGQSLIRVNAQQGTLTARWGHNNSEYCRFDYHLPEAGADKEALRRLSAVCNQVGANEKNDFR